MNNGMKKYIGPLLALPGFVLMMAVLVIPVGFSIYVSLYDCDYLQFTEFLGLGNYIHVLSDRSLRMDFVRTFFVTFASMACSMVVGTLLAIWILSSRNLVAYVLQMIGLIPWVTSMVVAALLWKWLLDYDLGLVNYVFTLLGLGKQTLLSKASTSIYGVIFVITWRTIGYSMVMIVAGLKAIPFELEEAASIDGCSGWQILRYVRLPLIKTQLLIASIVLTMSNFNNFVVPQTLTGGGPGTSSNVITISMYKAGFTYAQFGLSSAIALLILLINIVLVVNYVKAVKYNV
jgi:ABC-type sugar transport system permease subunit